MTTQTDAISEKMSRPPAERRVILQNVRWATYEGLLTDLANQSSIRLAYDQGTLEIMSPLAEHERINRTLSLLIEILAEELSIDIESLGSTTFKREDLERGFEPDSCFYIQHESSISGKSRIDLTIDPPPDLVVEVDITSGSLDKFPIYAKIGVPEIWRHDGKRLNIHILSGEEYIETDRSLAFPFLSGAGISGFLENSRDLKRTALLQKFREWIRKQQS